MQRAHSQLAAAFQRIVEARMASKRFPALALACVSSFMSVTALAAPYVQFDIAPTAECRDVTPQQRIAQYPYQRLIEVSLPVSVRFRGASMDDVDELAIEVDGAAAGLSVEDFSPTTQLASDISHDIETTTTSTKGRSLDGSLGGTLPIPGASAVAHLTPSITGGVTDCNTATEKINRLPPKHAVVVSGTTLEGRGVFFKLKRYSQTSLEGVHELSITFVAPRDWQWSEIRVNCAARGERKMLWMKQTGIIGQCSRTVQLVRMSPKPVRQLVLKPTEAGEPATKKVPPTENSAKSATGWRPSRRNATSAKMAVHATGKEAPSDKTPVKAKRVANDAD